MVSFSNTKGDSDMKGMMSGITLLVGVLAGTLGMASGTVAADSFSTDVARQIEKVKSILSEVEVALGSIAKRVEKADKDADVLIAKIQAGASRKEVTAELKRLIAALDDADARRMNASDRLGEVLAILNGLRSNPTVQGSRLLSVQVRMLFNSVAKLQKIVEEVTEDSAAVRAKLARITVLASK